MEAIDTIYKMWPVALASVTLIVWLIRLEGRTNHGERQMAKLEGKHEALESGIVGELTEIKIKLATIFERLPTKQRIKED